MATRFIESVADATAVAAMIPNTPGKAGIVHRQDINQLEFRDPISGNAYRVPMAESSVQTLRVRATLAQVNAGLSLLAAIPGRKYRLVTAYIIAIGGAAGTGTTVDLLATQATAGVKLVAWAQASLTRSTRLQAGVSGAAILADGASFVNNDVNTAITIGATGTFDTATHFDIEVCYVIAV